MLNLLILYFYDYLTATELARYCRRFYIVDFVQLERTGGRSGRARLFHAAVGGDRRGGSGRARGCSTLRWEGTVGAELKTARLVRLGCCVLSEFLCLKQVIIEIFCLTCSNLVNSSKIRGFNKKTHC